MFRILYNLGIKSYYFLILIASVFYPKAGDFIKGRKNWKKAINSIPVKDKNPVWIHCSSLGEFEQGRPVIEQIRKDYPDIFLILSFFSPSGYNIRKNYNGVDKVIYMPVDTPSNARYFINTIKPRAAVFIKYEMWYNHIKQLYKAKIPVFLVSAVFRKEQIFFKWYGRFFKKMLNFYSEIFVQNNESYELLQKEGLKNISVGGDTRFDRVLEITSESFTDNIIEEFVKNDYPVLIAGSTWPADEELIAGILKRIKNIRIIIAPHENDTRRLEFIKDKFSDYNLSFYSETKTKNSASSEILVIDKIGFLSKIYRFGDFAYIGGGFGKGIHNVLEATCYGIPVFFGPNYKRFVEAVDLIKINAAYSVNDSHKMSRIIEKMLTNKEEKIKAGENAIDYVNNKKGASKIILSSIKKYDVL